MSDPEVAKTTDVMQAVFQTSNASHLTLPVHRAGELSVASIATAHRQACHPPLNFNQL